MQTAEILLEFSRFYHNLEKNLAIKGSASAQWSNQGHCVGGSSLYPRKHLLGTEFHFDASHLQHPSIYKLRKKKNPEQCLFYNTVFRINRTLKICRCIWKKDSVCGKTRRVGEGSWSWQLSSLHSALAPGTASRAVSRGPAPCHSRVGRIRRSAEALGVAGSGVSWGPSNIQPVRLRKCQQKLRDIHEKCQWTVRTHERFGLGLG